VASEPITRRQTSKAPNGDNPLLEPGAINRRNVLLGGTTLAAASAIATSDNTLNVARAQQATGSQQQTPNVVFILSDNVGYGDLGHMVEASCAVRRHHGLIGLRGRVCGLPSFWSSRPVRRRGPP
jgi:hypothetical protein